MTIIESHVKTVDRSIRFLPPTRTVQIRTDRGDILTPTRASTSYEFKRKAQVPSDITIESDISFNFQRINCKNIQSLLTTNEYLENLARRIELNNRLEQYSKLRVFLLQPTTSKKWDEESNSYLPSGMDFLKASPKRLTDFLSIIIGAQYRLNLDAITIPFLDLPLNNLKEVIFQANIAIEKLKSTPIFIIDMLYPAFAEIVNYIIEHTKAPLIGLIFRDYLKAVQSYRALSTLADKDIAFFAVQVDRVDMHRDNIAVMHYLPFLANDVYAVEIPTQFVPQPSQAQKQFNINNIRFFNNNTLQVNSLSIDSIDTKIQEYHNNKIISRLLQNYTQSVDDAKIYGMLNAFSKIDELKSSLSEFGTLQKFIKQDSANDYIQQKVTLNKVLQPMKPNNIYDKWFG